MADYTSITNSQVDPKAPVTSELMYALRDNPIAIAEGAVGAPIVEVSWHHLETIYRSTTSTSPLAFTTSLTNFSDIRLVMVCDFSATSSFPTVKTVLTGPSSLTVESTALSGYSTSGTASGSFVSEVVVKNVDNGDGVLNGKFANRTLTAASFTGEAAKVSYTSSTGVFTGVTINADDLSFSGRFALYGAKRTQA